MATYDQPIIIKKIKKTAHAHHGGAWKIAYADFVTAMMAFFLLLWLISMTTPEQKKGLADYFAPASVSETTSGAGGVLAGKAFDTAGAKTSNAEVEKQPGVAVVNAEGLATIDSGVGKNTLVEQASSGKSPASDENINSDYQGEFAGAAASIRAAWQAMPNITDVEQNLLVEVTPEGLNIIIMDQAGRPMFPEGSRFPFEKTRQAIAAAAPILARLPNQITISGHTASGSQYADAHYGAWDLSSDRANTTRSLLGEFGVGDDHFRSVDGRAASDPLFPNDPYLSGNGRVEITVLPSSPPVPPGFKY